MRGHHRVVHPEAALAVSAGITGITFAAVVAVMAVQHASEQATDIRNAGQTPAPAPTTTSATPTPTQQPATTIIVQQPAPQTRVLTVTKEAPPAATSSAAPRTTPEARDLTPTSTTRRSPYTDMTQMWPSFAGNVFDLFVR